MAMKSLTRCGWYYLLYKPSVSVDASQSDKRYYSLLMHETIQPRLPWIHKLLGDVCYHTLHEASPNPNWMPKASLWLSGLLLDFTSNGQNLENSRTLPSEI